MRKIIPSPSKLFSLLNLFWYRFVWSPTPCSKPYLMGKGIVFATVVIVWNLLFFLKSKETLTKWKKRSIDKQGIKHLKSIHSGAIAAVRCGVAWACDNAGIAFFRTAGTIVPSQLQLGGWRKTRLWHSWLSETLFFHLFILNFLFSSPNYWLS